MEPPSVAPRPAADGSPDRPAPPSPRRNCLGHRHVCIDFSPGARGLFISVELSPRPGGRGCGPEPAGTSPDVARLVEELRETLGIVHSDRLRSLPGYESLPGDLLVLRHVAMVDRGEPNGSPCFVEALEAIIHLRALRRFPFFKLILETDVRGLRRPEVLDGLTLLTPRDEVWVRVDPDVPPASPALEAASGSWAKRHPELVRLACRRPLILQGHFSAVAGEVPTPRSIEAFAQGLRSIKEAGAQVPLVHIYTESAPGARPPRTALPLRTLFQIAREVRTTSGLPVEVF